jgi:hypothetical protein
MRHSSLEWQERFAVNHAQGHEWEGEPGPKRRVQTAQASWSLLRRHLTTSALFSMYWLAEAWRPRATINGSCRASIRGMRLVHAVLPEAVPGEHPAIGWLRIGSL